MAPVPTYRKINWVFRLKTYEGIDQRGNGTKSNKIQYSYLVFNKQSVCFDFHEYQMYLVHCYRVFSQGDEEIAFSLLQLFSFQINVFQNLMKWNVAYLLIYSNVHFLQKCCRSCTCGANIGIRIMHMVWLIFTHFLIYWYMYKFSKALHFMFIAS